MHFFTNFVRVSTMFLFAFAASFQLVGAVPISLVGAHELIVFNPPITSPKASVAWAKGSQQTVRWDTKGIPPQNTKNTGVLLLGYMENDSENLDIDHPLATGFTMGTGSVKVVMPEDVPTRDDYFVVLFGDSGNRSQKFRIH